MPCHESGKLQCFITTAIIAGELNNIKTTGYKFLIARFLQERNLLC